MNDKRWDDAFATLEPKLVTTPFPKEVVATLRFLVEEIGRIEKARGEIARAERSSLAREAQPYQNLIDRMLYRMAGLTDDEARALEERLERML